MSMSSALAPKPSIWRRAGSSVALAASLAFAFQPSLLLAQAQVSDPDAPVHVQPTHAAPAKTRSAKKSRHTATDKVSDELNRREGERVAQMMRDMAAAPAPAALATATVVAAPVSAAPALAVETKAGNSEPPTVAAILPRQPIVTASLTPDVPAQQILPAAGPDSSGVARAVPVWPAAQTPAPQAVAPQTPVPQRLAQTPPPAPVPIRPPSAAGGATQPAQPVVTGGAPSRAFGQGQMVPTQQPTLTLEVNKGTAIKLPGPAATVFVAAPDIADVQVKSPGMIYVFAKKPGDTVLYAVDDHDRVLLNTIVRVTSPLSRIRDALEALHPGNGVTFDNQGDAIVLGGTVRSAAIAEDARRLALQHVANPAKIINNIQINAPNQVQLRVKIAEVRRDALKRIGVNWQNIGSFGLTSLLGSQNLAGAAVATISGVGGAPSALVRMQSGNFDALIDLLATQNQATILAEPNLIAMSGETASFLAGGEIPVIAPQAGLTGSTFSVSYKQVGVSLAFTPTILGERINLKVSPEVSQLSTTGSISVPLTATAVVTVPGIQTRRATTTVELGSGQSFAIAGLMLRTSEQDVTKVPWLGDVPILGTLFKSDAYQRDETELVIVVTPYFVEPTSGKLRTPLSGRVPPTDADRIIYQRLNNPTPPNRISVGRESQYAGPSAGFKLD
ncbi:MAG: pilus assembly protein N-terminal domain-containing protein [Reyranellales bacterium]